ncbi:CatB-related O-acetyltransferase [Novipirellula rosea]|uniref:CatB-related O-acetyltransferase n=1 Tax=Novipirellula rosea TaxID=1031540 RepID=A0ABP8MVZ4_9BACT
MLIRRFRRMLTRRFGRAPKFRWTREQENLRGYEIGSWTYGSPAVFDWGEGSRLSIGKFCSIADGVKIFLGGEHRVDWASTYPFNILWDGSSSVVGHPSSKGDVRIGNDVWIATDSVILSGVSIGDGAVIGARSVVARNVAPYSIVVGNPAKELRKRFSDTDISRLLAMKWWELPDDQIATIAPHLQDADLESLFKKLEELANGSYDASSGSR